MLKRSRGFNVTFRPDNASNQIVLNIKLIQLVFLISFFAVSSSASVSRNGINFINSFDIVSKEYSIHLPFSIRLFGEGKFSKIYVNAVGGVSFGSGISTSRLDLVNKSKVIIFSPLLLMPDQPADIQVQYLFNKDEKLELQGKFRKTAGVFNFELENAVTLHWNETKIDGNQYNISFAIDRNERAYVIYEFDRVKRINDTHGFARSGIFALEDRSILCPVELKGSGTPDIADVDDFSLRVDLPLACDSFNYSCDAIDGKNEEIQNEFRAEWQGYFFETISVTDWSFYRLYLCISRLTKADGTNAIREVCGYDADYYEYSWRELPESEKCFRNDLA